MTISEDGFDGVGRRYQMAPERLSRLELLIDCSFFLFKLQREKGSSRDAPMFQYSRGDSQGHHIDPCHAQLYSY